MKHDTRSLQHHVSLPPSFIITIDGGARTGTSSTAAYLADVLSCSFLDSGAIYRCITYAVLEVNIDPSAIEEVIKIAEDCDIKFSHSPVGQHIYLNGSDVTSVIRTDRVSKIVPQIAQIPEVRERAFEIQKSVGNQLVAEGRDMGTVVFPEADIKFFLIASLDERAKRHWRYLKDQQAGNEDGLPSLDQIADDLDARDRADETRNIAPLRPAEDAFIIDTTELTVAQAVDRMIEEIKKIV